MVKFAGSRAFVVEDEALVLFSLEDVLSELGCEVAVQATRLDQAITLARGQEPVDVAILDVNLGGSPVFPVAQILQERGVPLIFATGYGRDGLPPEWQGHAVIVKPYSLEDIERALTLLLGGTEGQ